MFKCAVVGGSGYIGGELIRLLLGHPQVKLVAVTANEMAGSSLATVHPNLRPSELIFGHLHEVGDADILFLALPAGKAKEVIAQFPHKKMIDTSPDFRFQHQDFIYGLPELFASQIKNAKHLASPGCFATAAILSIYPLIAESLHMEIVINAVTGSSGSGIKPQKNVHHPYRADSYFAYAPFIHRHIPEIKQAIKMKTGHDLHFIFQPHSGPFIRGIYATTVIKLNKKLTKSALFDIYKKYYLNNYFIRLLDDLPNIKWVQGTNYCDLGIEADGNTVIVTAAIDNLLKGGAAQAIQCFNIANGLDESVGLMSVAMNP